MKYFLIYIARIFLILPILIINACSSDDHSTKSPDEPFLINAEFVYSASAQQIKLLSQIYGIGVDANEFQHDIEIYRVAYNTRYDGSTISASGLIALPKTTMEVGMLSFQHGTLINHTDAPSNFSASNSNTLLYAAMASAGFIGVIPDYLGFGSSSTILHPYYIENLTASSIIDMLKAARELADQKSIQFNTKLFLAGYSEGGYATMATHKAIEENGLDGFQLIASFAGAGAYDVKGIQEHIFDLQEYGYPHYLTYIARAYQINYNEANLLGDFFQEPYATRIPSLFDGQKGADQINAQLTSNLSELVHEDVLNNIDTDTKYAYLVDAFNENSLTDWTPQIKLFMYHGLSDTTVPYQNSVDTFEKLLGNGTPISTLALIPLEGTHSTAIQPFITDFIPKLLALR